MASAKIAKSSKSKKTTKFTGGAPSRAKAATVWGKLEESLSPQDSQMLKSLKSLVEGKTDGTIINSNYRSAFDPYVYQALRQLLFKTYNLPLKIVSIDDIKEPVEIKSDNSIILMTDSTQETEETITGPFHQITEKDIRFYKETEEEDITTLSSEKAAPIIKVRITVGTAYNISTHIKDYPDPTELTGKKLENAIKLYQESEIFNDNKCKLSTSDWDSFLEYSKYPLMKPLTKYKKNDIRNTINKEVMKLVRSIRSGGKNKDKKSSKDLIREDNIKKNIAKTVKELDRRINYFIETSDRSGYDNGIKTWKTFCMGNTPWEHFMIAAMICLHRFPIANSFSRYAIYVSAKRFLDFATNCVNVFQIIPQVYRDLVTVINEKLESVDKKYAKICSKNRIKYEELNVETYLTQHPELMFRCPLDVLIPDMAVSLRKFQKEIIPLVKKYLNGSRSEFMLFLRETIGSGKTTLAFLIAVAMNRAEKIAFRYGSEIKMQKRIMLFCCPVPGVMNDLAKLTFHAGIPFGVSVSDSKKLVSIQSTWKKRPNDVTVIFSDPECYQKVMNSKEWGSRISVVFGDEFNAGASTRSAYTQSVMRGLVYCAPVTILSSATLATPENLEPIIANFKRLYPTGEVIDRDSNDPAVACKITSPTSEVIFPEVSMCKHGDTNADIAARYRKVTGIIQKDQLLVRCVDPPTVLVLAKYFRNKGVPIPSPETALKPLHKVKQPHVNHYLALIRKTLCELDDNTLAGYLKSMQMKGLKNPSWKLDTRNGNSSALKQLIFGEIGGTTLVVGNTERAAILIGHLLFSNRFDIKKGEAPDNALKRYCNQVYEKFTKKFESGDSRKDMKKIDKETKRGSKKKAISDRNGGSRKGETRQDRVMALDSTYNSLRTEINYPPVLQISSPVFCAKHKVNREYVQHERANEIFKTLRGANISPLYILLLMSGVGIYSQGSFPESYRKLVNRLSDEKRIPILLSELRHCSYGVNLRLENVLLLSGIGSAISTMKVTDIVSLEDLIQVFGRAGRSLLSFTANIYYVNPSISTVLKNHMKNLPIYPGVVPEHVTLCEMFKLQLQYAINEGFKYPEITAKDNVAKHTSYEYLNDSSDESDDDSVTATDVNLSMIEDEDVEDTKPNTKLFIPEGNWDDSSDEEDEEFDRFMQEKVKRLEAQKREKEKLEKEKLLKQLRKKEREQRKQIEREQYLERKAQEEEATKIEALKQKKLKELEDDRKVKIEVDKIMKYKTEGKYIPPSRMESLRQEIEKDVRKRMFGRSDNYNRHGRSRNWNNNSNNRGRGRGGSRSRSRGRGRGGYRRQGRSDNSGSWR
jgi:hypothetical protein